MNNLYFDIKEISCSLGENEVKPESLFSNDNGRLTKKTGISLLHRTEKTSYQLALEAINNSSNIKKYLSRIGCVIYVTQSAINFLPNHASMLQGELGISNDSICFDINQGCSGFVQALIVMISILPNIKNDLGLIVCTDTYSHHLGKTDRSTQSLFSDGSTAVIISKEKKWKIIDSNHFTDGNKSHYLQKPLNDDIKLNMEGSKIFQWTRAALGKSIRKLLHSNNFSIEDIDYFFIHQASKIVMENVRMGLDVKKTKIPSTLHLTGNLVSSSIPFLLLNNYKEFSNSRTIVLSGFGVGLSLSSTIIKNVS